FVLRDNLDRIEDKLGGWKDDLDDLNTKLIHYQRDIIRCSKDSLLNFVPQDSLLRVSFYERLGELRELWHKTDSLNRSDLSKVNLIQNKLSVAYSGVFDETDQIDSKIGRFAARALTGEYDYIWVPNHQYNSLDSAISATVKLNSTQIYYFLKNGTSVHLIGLLFLLIVTGWIFYTRAGINRDDHPETILDQTNYIYKNPVIASLLMATALIPYFYTHPPVACLEVMFLITIVLVLILVFENFPRTLFSFLCQLFVVTLFFSLSNLMIQITNADRFAVLFLSIASIIIAFLFYKKVRTNTEGQMPYTKMALLIFIGMQVIAVVLNFIGLFSISKIIAITAVFNLWMLLILYFVVQFIIQCLFMQFHTKTVENTLVSWVDYNILQKKFMGVLNTFAALLWLFFFLQNLNIDDWMHDTAKDFLAQDRTMGGSTFTFGGFVSFIMVIWLSSMASKVVSYFYDVSAQHASDLSVLKKKNRASTLLIRIGVFTVGFLLAVAASGFPLDKLTIIFSAFGVGIGFGLQNITNNLVSGMILAFEKPIQIGDIIQVDGKSGTVKEIGIRSSRLSTSDGSEVIIPNADLISHHVENWTLNNSNRRVQILISASYGSDIQKVKKLLNDLLCNREDIMEHPEPSVFVNNITDKSVDFRLLFWAADLSTSNTLKSRVLSDIYEAFNKEGIVIPAKP
ncbi:MAG: mechanosensitive ion channel domain-containing protein, partial [Mucilaginibacter sp.]